MSKLNKNAKKRLKIVVRQLLMLVSIFNPKIILDLKYYFRYRKEKKEWLKQEGKITKDFMILSDYNSPAGTIEGHYFHQDLLVAQLIHEHNPKRHIDIASRIDGFVAHVASYREIEVLDIRPLSKLLPHENIKFIQADFMISKNLGKTDSLSCLHAIEHFGLGRYGDSIDVSGHIKAITNLVDLVNRDGRLYISFPISKNDEVHFNAHRVLNVKTILQIPSIKNDMKLLRFDYIDDAGVLHTEACIDDINNLNEDIRYGCGIYTFLKN